MRVCLIEVFTLSESHAAEENESVQLWRIYNLYLEFRFQFLEMGGGWSCHSWVNFCSSLAYVPFAQIAKEENIDNISLTLQNEWINKYIFFFQFGKIYDVNNWKHVITVCDKNPLKLSWDHALNQQFIHIFIK